MFLFQGSLQSYHGLSYISLRVFHVSNGRAGRFLTARAGIRRLYRVKVWYSAPPVRGGASRLHDQGACACRCRPPPICSVQARALRSPALGLPLPGKSRIVAIAPDYVVLYWGCGLGALARTLALALALARPRPSRALANYYPKRPPAMLVVFDHFRARSRARAAIQHSA